MKGICILIDNLIIYKSLKLNLEKHKSATLVVGNQAHQNSLKIQLSKDKSVHQHTALPAPEGRQWLLPQSFPLLKADFPRTKSSFKAAFNKCPETVITPPSLPVCLN